MSYPLKTPVGFFIFNRPECTFKVFEKIREAKPPQLFIVADGPRDSRPEEKELCMQCRSVIELIDWPCDVKTKFAEENLGCGPNVSAGYDWIFSQVDEAIFLEDDTVPDISFFRYCEELLEKYRFDTRIGAISGNNFFFPDVFMGKSYSFSRIPHLWGWASWKRVWGLYDYNMTRFPDALGAGCFKHLLFNKYYTEDLVRVFTTLHKSTRKHTWDCQLFFAFLMNNLLTVIPSSNLVKNIGDIGTHFSTTSIYPFDKHSMINIPAGEIDFPLKHNKFVMQNTAIEEKSQAYALNSFNAFSKNVLLPCKRTWRKLFA